MFHITSSFPVLALSEYPSFAQRFHLPLALLVLSPLNMADGAQQQNVEGRGHRRNRPLAEGERSVRQHLDDLETRMDTHESKARAQDQRLLYLEAYTKVVLRGFNCVSEFLRAKDQDFKLAKQAFVASFVAELRIQCFAEATHVVDEAETLLCENQGIVVLGVFPTGGQLGRSLMPCSVCSVLVGRSGLVISLSSLLAFWFFFFSLSLSLSFSLSLPLSLSFILSCLSILQWLKRVRPQCESEFRVCFWCLDGFVIG